MDGRKLYNYWGYNTVSFFSPNTSYTASKEYNREGNELKNLIRVFNQHGIEVYLYVVFNLSLIHISNHVAPGPIGIIGASGTGIQELTTIIDRLGEGVKNAIGTGGRDLSTEVGGITMMDMIEAMEQDRCV